MRILRFCGSSQKSSLGKCKNASCFIRSLSHMTCFIPQNCPRSHLHKGAKLRSLSDLQPAPNAPRGERDAGQSDSGTLLAEPPPDAGVLSSLRRRRKNSAMQLNRMQASRASCT